MHHEVVLFLFPAIQLIGDVIDVINVLNVLNALNVFNVVAGKLSWVGGVHGLVFDIHGYTDDVGQLRKAYDCYMTSVFDLSTSFGAYFIDVLDHSMLH